MYPDYPAASPYVTSVGGTALTNAVSQVRVMSVWNHSNPEARPCTHSCSACIHP
jgi:subtilase family serine protease